MSDELNDRTYTISLRASDWERFDAQCAESVNTPEDAAGSAIIRWFIFWERERGIHHADHIWAGPT